MEGKENRADEIKRLNKKEKTAIPLTIHYTLWIFWRSKSTKLSYYKRERRGRGRMQKDTKKGQCLKWNEFGPIDERKDVEGGY